MHVADNVSVAFGLSRYRDSWLSGSPVVGNGGTLGGGRRYAACWNYTRVAPIDKVDKMSGTVRRPAKAGRAVSPIGTL